MWGLWGNNLEIRKLLNFYCGPISVWDTYININLFSHYKYLPDKYCCFIFINGKTERPCPIDDPWTGACRKGAYSPICHLIIEWSWESCLFSVINVDLVLMILKSCPALTFITLVYTIACYSTPYTGQRHCWQMLYFPSHLCDPSLQIYSFYKHANCFLQNTPKSNTPPEVDSENDPETAHSCLGNPFSEINQNANLFCKREKTFCKVGHRHRVLFFFKYKDNFQHDIFEAN